LPDPSCSWPRSRRLSAPKTGMSAGDWLGRAVRPCLSPSLVSGGSEQRGQAPPRREACRFGASPLWSLSPSLVSGGSEQRGQAPPQQTALGRSQSPDGTCLENGRTQARANTYECSCFHSSWVSRRLMMNCSRPRRTRPSELSRPWIACWSCSPRPGRRCVPQPRRSRRRSSSPPASRTAAERK